MSYSRAHMYNRISTKKRKNLIFNHFIKRCRERFDGLDIQYSDIERVIKQIREGKSIPCGKQSNARTFHIVNLYDNDMVVVYNKERDVVHTCFPPNWLHKTKALQI